MHLVYLEQEIELLALVTARGEFALNVFDDVLNLRVVGIHEGALEGARKEGVGKISGIGRAAGAHGDKARQVLVFRAQPVKHPAADGRPYLLHLTGVLHVGGRAMRRGVGIG